MYNLENLTLILNSYNCDKNCPFCIAKNNKKFLGKEESFEELEMLFEKLMKANLRFDRFVLSGNGEPSLYSKEVLQQICESVQRYSGLFSKVRLHTSGNIFYDEEKLKLFQNIFNDKLEIDFLRISLDSRQDMSVLGYSKDYINSELFKTANNLKMDIGLTNLLNSSEFTKELNSFLEQYPNIRTVRFKKLMSGENQLSSQAQWIKVHLPSKQIIVNIAYNLIQQYGSNQYTEFETQNGVTIKFEKTGNYNKDIVISNGILQGYNENELSIKDLIKISNRENEDKSLEL